MKMVPTRAILGKTLCIKISVFETYAYLFAYDVGLLTACSFMRLSWGIPLPNNLLVVKPVFAQQIHAEIYFVVCEEGGKGGAGGQGFQG